MTFALKACSYDPGIPGCIYFIKTIVEKLIIISQ